MCFQAACTTKYRAHRHNRPKLIANQTPIHQIHFPRKSLSEKASTKSACSAKESGISPNTAKSKSEYGFALPFTREPNTHTVRCEICCCKIVCTICHLSGEIFNSTGMIFLVIFIAKIVLPPKISQCLAPQQSRFLHRKCGSSACAYRGIVSNPPNFPAINFALWRCE